MNESVEEGTNACVRVDDRSETHHARSVGRASELANRGSHCARSCVSRMLLANFRGLTYGSAGS